MKLATFEVSTTVGPLQRVGAVVDDQIVDLQLAYARYLEDSRGVARGSEIARAIIPDMLGFIDGGSLSSEAAEMAVAYASANGAAVDRDRGQLVYALSEVRLRPPLRPNSIRDTLNFELHMKNALKALDLPIPKLWYEMPTYYRGTHSNIAGPEDPILWPSFTEQLDYELEFVCCIGKQGQNISKEKAGEHIFGYMIYNDVSARDILRREMTLGTGPAKGKNFANANIIGPYLVTADEIDPNNLKMVARVNEEVWSEANSKDMYFKFNDLIAYISREEPLYSGELIGSGTPGFGSCLELGKWIKPGDVVELDIEGLGVLRNRVERRA